MGLTHLFDSNVLIDSLCGEPRALGILEAYPAAAISIITRIKVLSRGTAAMLDAARLLLNAFELLPLNEGIADRAASLRRDHRMKTPDAIIWATAAFHGLTLVTRDERNLDVAGVVVDVPYRL